MRHWKPAFALAAFGAISLAWAGQVPNPINADGTIVAGHFVLGNGAQRAVDSGWSLVPMANGGCNAALTPTPNDLLYSTSVGCSLLPTANNSVLATSGAGAPAWTTTLPAGITIPAGDCPLPTASAVGCVEAANPVSHEWVYDVDTSGIPHLSQPAFADILGTATVAQGGTGGATGKAAMANLSGSYTICQAAPNFALTGTTSKTQMNATQCRIPANSLAVGSCVEVWMLFSWTNNADTKLLYWSLNSSSGTGGSSFFSATETTNTSAVDEHSFCVTATGTESGFAGGSAFGNTSNAIGTLSLSAASDMYVNFVGQDVTSGSDTLTLVAYWVRLQSTAGN
jgi:hypothetical protein